MLLLKALVVSATTLGVFARPLRMTRGGQDQTLLVLQFASVLEGLESQFYQQGIQKFSDQDFQNAGFSSTSIVADQLTTIQKDEASHLDFLQKGLAAFGSSAPEGCQFNFDSALTDVPTMAATARVVENVGVGAYLGGAVLIEDPQILVAAASILTTEARHSTILNAMSGAGSPIPQPFDIALLPNEVLAIAGPFIQGCDLGIPSNKPLQVTNSGSVNIGTQLSFNFDGMDGMDGMGGRENLHCQMLVGGAVNTISLPIDQCVVPEGIDGPVALFITSDSQPLPNNVVLRQYANNIVAGPVLTFIDAQPNPLSQLLRAGVSGGQIDSSDSSNSGSGPNFNTGSEGGGAVIVDGWTNLPNGQQAPNNGNNNQDQSQSQDGQDQSGQDQSQDGQDQSGQDQSQPSQDNQSQSQSQDNQSQSQSQDDQSQSQSQQSQPSTSQAPAATPTSGSAGAQIIA